MKTLLRLLLFLPLFCLSCTTAEEPPEIDVTRPARPWLNVAAASDSMERLELYGRPVPSVLHHNISTTDEAMDFMRNSPFADKYLDGIIPIIAKQTPDYAKKLLQSRFPYFIIVDKQTMTLYLYDRFGRQVRTARMACSRHFGTKHKFRDNRTPEGFFSAYGIYDSAEWKYTDDDGYTSDAIGVYGPRFVRLSTRVSSSIGIHGTNSPWSPGHRVSHGCIRLHNDNIKWLVRYVQKGTPIIVNPSLEDDRVNREEECNITMFSLDGRERKPLPLRPKASEQTDASSEQAET